MLKMNIWKLLNKSEFSCLGDPKLLTRSVSFAWPGHYILDNVFKYHISYITWQPDNKRFIWLTAARWFFVPDLCTMIFSSDITILSEFFCLLSCVNGLGKLQMN